MNPSERRDKPYPMQPDVVDMPDLPDSYGGQPQRRGGFVASFFQQPPGLFPLFFTEMWERFSFYLLMGSLALYLTNYLGYSASSASDVTTTYMSLIYFTPFLGGLIADRLTGYVKAIVAGGLLMMAGHVMLAFDSRESAGHYFLFGALALLILGNGLFKPNISTMVGNLYGPGDPRRDQGFTLFYMGINLGATLGPLTASYLQTHGAGHAARLLGRPVPQEAGWHIAFGSAGVGMLLSLFIFLGFRKRLAAAAAAAEFTPGRYSGRATTPAEVDRSGGGVLRFGQWFNMGLVTFFLAWLLLGKALVERLGTLPEAVRDFALWPTSMEHFFLIWLVLEVVTVVIFLSGNTLECANVAKLKSIFVIVALFWMAFHQNSVTLSFFADQHTETTINPVVFAAINPAFIILLSPVMVLLWGYLGDRGREPSSVSKMVLGMFVTGLAYSVMVGAGKFGGDTGKVGPGWLIGCYFFLTVAELWISPIGLSLTSKLAPANYKGLWMGFWFLATAVGNKLVHVVGQYWDQYPPSQLFLFLVISSVVAAVALDYIVINLRRFGPTSSDA